MPPGTDDVAVFAVVSAETDASGASTRAKAANITDAATFAPPCALFVFDRIFISTICFSSNTYIVAYGAVY